jgi:hypothetical protein
MDYEETFVYIAKMTTSCTFITVAVARVRRRGENIHPQDLVLMWQMWGDKKFLSFISGKIEWKSPPSILVTRNPNWSQRSGTGTGCVKERY